MNMRERDFQNSLKILGIFELQIKIEAKDIEATLVWNRVDSAKQLDTAVK